MIAPRVDRLQQVPALVLGHSVTALGTVRSLGRAGIPAYCICKPDDFAARSRWARCIPNTLEDTSTVDDLTDFLLSLPFERVVLIPCSDWWAQRVARLDPALRRRFLYVGSTSDVIDRVNDKLAFAELSQAHDIPHPSTIPVNGPDDLATLPISPDSSYFIKARDSQALTMLLGIKACCVSSVEEAQQRLAQVRAVGQHVLLQEHIPGPPTNHYFVDGFADPDGVVRARLVRQRLRMHPWPFGNSTYMRTIAAADVPDIVETVDRLIAAAGLRGIFSVELKRDTRDGIAKVLDINARPWWYVEFAAWCGVNVCEMAYRTALGEPVPAVTTYPVNRTCTFPIYDFPACTRALRQGELTPFGWAWSWLRSKHTILSLRDPLPYIHCYSSLAFRFLRGRTRKVQGRIQQHLPGWLSPAAAVAKRA